LLRVVALLTVVVVVVQPLWVARLAHQLTVVQVLPRILLGQP
jgi:hypothetical protein